MSTYKVEAIPAFQDNYIWCITNGKNAIIVDPGDASAVLNYLEQQKLELSAILITHHHPDHTGGVQKLKQAFPNCRRIGYAQARYDKLDEILSAGDTVCVNELNFKVFATPGHTLDHIVFYTESGATPWLFSGDTLFSGGCGRLFEGSAEQMYQSLEQLKQLSPKTNIYCAHEYTLANLKFAKKLMPNNSPLTAYQEECKEKREHKQSTIPTRLSNELEINPFLRTFDQELIASLRQMDYKSLDTAIEVFAAIRHAKDNF